MSYAANTVGVFQVNDALEKVKVCYTPKAVVVTQGNNLVDARLAEYQSVLAAYDLTRYTDTDSYLPGRALKRNEAAKMLVGIAKNILCREKTATFQEGMYSDIEGTDPTLIPYIKEAYEYGIMK